MTQKAIGGNSHPLVPTHGCQPDITLMFTSPFSRSEIVFFFRLSLYNRSLPCGAKAIRQEMESERISPLPSTSTIHRITGTIWSDTWAHWPLSTKLFASSTPCSVLVSINIVPWASGIHLQKLNRFFGAKWRLAVIDIQKGLCSVQPHITKNPIPQVHNAADHYIRIQTLNTSNQKYLN